MGKWSYGSNNATSVWRASGHKIKVESDSMVGYTSVTTHHFVGGQWHEVLPSQKVHQPEDVFAAESASENTEFITNLHREAVARTVEFLDK